MLISRFFSAAPRPSKPATAEKIPEKEIPDNNNTRKPEESQSKGPDTAKKNNEIKARAPIASAPMQNAAKSSNTAEPNKNTSSDGEKDQILESKKVTPVKRQPTENSQEVDTPATAVISSPSASRVVPESSQSGDDDEPPVARKRRRRLFIVEDDDDESGDEKPTKKTKKEDPDFDMGTNAEESDSDASMEVIDENHNEKEEEEADDSEMQIESDAGPGTTLVSYSLQRGDNMTEIPRDAKQKRRFNEKIGRLEKNSFFLRRTGGGGGDAESDKEGDKKGKTIKYTPLESQIVKLKKKYPDMILVVECGYKYRMFDQDASTASKVLRLAAFFDHNFLTCSFPTHRLAHHVRRLVAAGFKVGVISQSETAALKKASSKSSKLFERKLTAVYTKGTITADGKLVGSGNGGIIANEASYIMSILETSDISDDGDTSKRSLAIAAVDCASGEVFFDCFANDTLCSDLESRLVAVEPVEIIMPKDPASKTTELVVKAYTETMGARLERVPNLNFSPDDVTHGLRTSVENNESTQKKSVQAILSCLGALIEYLKQFQLELSMTSALEFKSFRSSRQMKIGADVLRNFEVFGNSNNGGIEGSLINLVNRTSTPFGSRQIRQWLSHPLTDPQEIRDRLDVVEYLRPYIDEPGRLDSSEVGENAVISLIDSLAKLPDLERGLTRVSCHKCTPSEFIGVVNAIDSIGEKLDYIKSLSATSSYPRLLAKLFSSTPVVSKTLESGIMRVLNKDAAAADKRFDLFSNNFSPEEALQGEEGAADFLASVNELYTANEDLQSAEKGMTKLLRKLRERYNQPRWEWKKVAQEEFLIEVPTSRATKMPRSWTVISQTKAVKRFRPEGAEEGYETVQCARETRDAVSASCWQAYLELFALITGPLRAVVKTLVDLDCLASLARVSNLSGYCKPQVETDSTVPAGLHAKDARHPLTEILPACTSYVPNDIQLGRGNDEIAVVISGPNYGGKSSYARMTALIAILAQLGSYVPASSAKISPFDSIHARMGSTDSIAKGMSSLMVELSETSRILSAATNRTLVVLDELGRGTSTHDGSAIAYATLSDLVGRIGCTTLFVTHYPMLATLRIVYPKLVTACFMNYREEKYQTSGGNSASDNEEQPRSRTKITFLYKLTEGVASSSYGLNVARLAGIPSAVIDTAQVKAIELESKVKETKKEGFVRSLLEDATWKSDNLVRKQLAMSVRL